jgi:uncharacterized membrane protein (DUF2068 family)
MGVTIAAVLSVFAGVLAILAIAGTMLLASLAGAPVDTTAGGIFGGFFAVTGVIILTLGVAYLVTGYGLWQLRKWAWMVALVLSIISLVFMILGLVGGGGLTVNNIVSLAVAGVIIYYLNTPLVKSAFGRG